MSTKKPVVVPSFSVNHLTLKEGLYLREIKKLNFFTKIYNWDLRFKAPADRKYLTNGVMHSIEHIMALKLREIIGDKYIGFYTYGCKTGFCLTTKPMKKEEVRNALVEVIEHTIPILSKEEIPCLTPEECGQPSLYSLQDTTTALSDYLHVLETV